MSDPKFAKQRTMRFARISQWFFLLLFLFLFLQTEYRVVDEINAAVNGFFRANPLTAATTLLAATVIRAADTDRHDLSP